MAGNGSSASKANEVGEVQWEYKMKKIVENAEKINALLNEQKPYPCIFRVPEVLREQNQRAYSPSTVSIGPLHHKKNQHLEEMELCKLSYMYNLFLRTEDSLLTQKKDKSTLENCQTAMLVMEQEARQFYAEEVNFAAEEFAEMMLIDGCFIIELLFCGKQRKNHPILRNASMMVAIRHDLLMLENQIPFSVLEKLFELTISKIPQPPCPTVSELPHPPSLSVCLHSFFGDMLGLGGIEIKTMKDRRDNETDHHLLSLLRNCYLPNAEPEEEHNTTYISLPEDHRDKFKFKSSATTLDLAGVGFEVGNKKNLFDVKFSTSFFEYCKTDFDAACCHLGLFRRAHLEIPPFSIFDSTEPFLRNLIAFEQCHLEIETRYFTSLAIFMDRLINSPADVELLVKANIIKNNLGSSEEVSLLFNNICKYVAPGSTEPSCIKKPCMLVEKYCGQSLPRSLAKLKRDYFGSPWACISVIAALVLFSIALLQTVYAMLSFYN